MVEAADPERVRSGGGGAGADFEPAEAGVRERGEHRGADPDGVRPDQRAGDRPAGLPEVPGAEGGEHDRRGVRPAHALQDPPLPGARPHGQADQDARRAGGPRHPRDHGPAARERVLPLPLPLPARVHVPEDDLHPAQAAAQPRRRSTMHLIYP